MKTVNDYKEKLTVIHDAIKENPFRRDHVTYAKYGEGYFETLRKFSDAFYELAKAIRDKDVTGVTDEDKKLIKVAKFGLFFHDFNSRVNRGYNLISNYNATENLDKIKYIYEDEQFLEACISCIHCYIEDGLFNRYPYIDRTTKGLGWVIWSNTENDFVFNRD